MTRGRLRASDYVALAARMRVAARYSGPCAADDLRLADEWGAQARRGRRRRRPFRRRTQGMGSGTCWEPAVSSGGVAVEVRCLRERTLVERNPAMRQRPSRALA